jgi:iron-sulfur cluster insertion protein
MPRSLWAVLKRARAPTTRKNNRRFNAEKLARLNLSRAVLADVPSPPYLEPVDINLSPSAAARVALIAQKQRKPAILRLAVEGGGCSGFQYRFDLAEKADDDDTTVEQDGVQLVVDAMSLDLVRGATVDFVENLGGAAFRVENPNAASGCGCGASFSV